MAHPEDDTGSLERARARLYKQGTTDTDPRTPLAEQGVRVARHAWERSTPTATPSSRGERHVRLAGMFFMGALLFFLISVGAAVYFFYYGGNSVSVDKVSVSIQGPTTIAGGDTLTLSLTIINKNPVAIDNATIEIGFPEGSRSASDVLKPYPRYTENLGTLASGAIVTVSVKAV